MSVVKFGEICQLRVSRLFDNLLISYGIIIERPPSGFQERAVIILIILELSLNAQSED
jgi:hypothetical protein